MERVVAGLLLVVCLPAMLLLALLIRQSAGGPVLVTNEFLKVDGGHVCRRYRFRTTAQGQPFFRSLGRIIQRYAIDEWPGLLNVLRGELRLRELLKARCQNG